MKMGKNGIEEKDIPLFKELYEKAVKDGEGSFIFKGEPVLTSYAKYVVEYLDSRK